MQFHSVAVVLPIYDRVGDYNQMPIFEATCPLGTYARNGVVEDRRYDGLSLLRPGVTNVGALSCNGMAARYAVQILETDGGLNGANDNFGWRFYVSGTYPFGASIGYVCSFYKNTWRSTRSAYLRLVYQ